jgi:hypothetical protein
MVAPSLKVRKLNVIDDPYVWLHQRRAEPTRCQFHTLNVRLAGRGVAVVALDRGVKGRNLLE